jgi:putative oxidoreductase
MWLRTINTDNNPVGTVLRWTLAIVMFPHGAQKVLGWFGGHGFAATFDYFTQSLGVPALLVLLVLAAEFLGPFALAAGALTRVAAAGIGAVMLGAVYMAHLPNGFFMNWSGGQAGEGFEYHLLVLGIVAGLLITGAGAISVDRRLAATEP